MIANLFSHFVAYIHKQAVEKMRMIFLLVVNFVRNLQTCNCKTNVWGGVIFPYST